MDLISPQNADPVDRSRAYLTVEAAAVRLLCPPSRCELGAAEGRDGRHGRSSRDYRAFAATLHADGVHTKGPINLVRTVMRAANTSGELIDLPAFPR
jgi:hypothetical protein